MEILFKDTQLNVSNLLYVKERELFGIKKETKNKRKIFSIYFFM